MAAVATPSSAATSPTRTDILNDCYSGVGKCTFTTTSVSNYVGVYRPVLPWIHNCSTSPQTYSRTIYGKPFSVTMQSRWAFQVYYAPVLQKATGYWTTHYDDPHWGHYFWKVTDTISRPLPNATDAERGLIDYDAHPMTPDESKVCRR
ncbi:hypothetical protein ACFVJ4_09175 [Streptomyces sp. NPDC127178]|uniref:hypothetical protein n=1 Tax=unclassified Streptomyces TaxID=2593676 RepID=UPI00363EC823